MSDNLMSVGANLAATLEEENAALAALDFPRVGAMLARKQRALADMAAMRATPQAPDGAERMARRLQGLALENKRLLEHAIAAQDRVIGVIAQAAAPAVAPMGYGSARGQRPAAFALSAKA